VSALLDVNVLVALFDPAHIHHDAAHDWFGACREDGWATCPLTENGFVRVLSNPGYPGRRTTVADAGGRLERLTHGGGHAFWADELSLLDASVINRGQLSGHRQITDAYLLALAVSNDGCVVTFDRGLPFGAVYGAEAEHVVVL
jgi:uncharacterized protein